MNIVYVETMETTETFRITHQESEFIVIKNLSYKDSNMRTAETLLRVKHEAKKQGLQVPRLEGFLLDYPESYDDFQLVDVPYDYKTTEQLLPIHQLEYVHLENEWLIRTFKRDGQYLVIMWMEGELGEGMYSHRIIETEEEVRDVLLLWMRSLRLKSLL